MANRIGRLNVNRTNAAAIRENLRGLGCEQLAGADNPVVEIWVTQLGEHFPCPISGETSGMSLYERLLTE